MRSEKGFSAIDVVIALIVIVGFISIIAGGFYNYFVSSTGTARSSAALAYTIDVIESVEQMNYDDITSDSVKAKVDELYKSGRISKAYEVETQLIQYNKTMGNEKKQDLIKTLTVTVRYELSNRTQWIQIKRLITK